MYAGQIVEKAPVVELFARPRHPYTRGLMHSIPRLGEHKARLAEIPGIVPSLTRALPGCRFASRCAERLARCATELPPSVEVEAQHNARCWLHVA
jgi:oligopeptide/dipeptide ABC transporter ATP-binding protein